MESAPRAAPWWPTKLRLRAQLSIRKNTIATPDAFDVRGLKVSIQPAPGRKTFCRSQAMKGPLRMAGVLLRPSCRHVGHTHPGRYVIIASNALPPKAAHGPLSDRLFSVCWGAICSTKRSARPGCYSVWEPCP
jgi:hypothetical protein